MAAGSIVKMFIDRIFAYEQCRLDILSEIVWATLHPAPFRKSALRRP